ncbi:MAG: IS1 transposase [Candidatus Scalindua rubra]|uniref:IS1 transposase n=1 Tax=Candidatus Scalindua rubra TaxID=1872076 RepID=A0A1E3X3J2_9BACT|nr:MAG: IS1 transposase [Candidatus Scalindua rubra]
MISVSHKHFFVYTDLLQRRYEYMRSVYLGLTNINDALMFYGFTLKDYNNFEAVFSMYSFPGLLGLKVEDINKPKCKQHDIRNTTYINRKYGNRKISYMKCPTCNHIFSSKQGTALYRSHVADKEYCQVITALAEGMGIRSTGRIFGIDKDTVLRLLKDAAEHCRKVSKYFLQNLHIEECQIDELWSFVMKKEKNLTPLDEIAGAFGDQWIWISIDATHKTIPFFVVGKHTLKNAIALIQGLKNITNDHIPFFTSDQLPHYPEALLRVYGISKIVPSTGRRGRPRRPELIPPPSLKYAQVVKTRRKGRVVDIQVKAIYGNDEDIKERLESSKVSHCVNVSFVERANGTLTHINKRLTRKTYCFSKDISYHKDQLDLSLAYYHLVKPHKGLRLEINQNGRRWQERTPFYAAGLTDHIWTMKELLTYKVP